MTLPELVGGRGAGVAGLHADVGDVVQRDVRSPRLCAGFPAEMERRAQGFEVQMTSEAAGGFAPAIQHRLNGENRPLAVALVQRDTAASQDAKITQGLFVISSEPGIGGQHNLYDETDIVHVADPLTCGDLPRDDLMVLLVAGRYISGDRRAPADVSRCAPRLQSAVAGCDGAARAFGPRATACLTEAERLGGAARLGFYKSRLNADCAVTVSNTVRVL